LSYIFLNQAIYMKYFSLLIFVLYIKSGISIAQSTFIQTGSTWKYFDQGSLNNTNWKNNSYNDNSWASGPSELGYGDGDEATVVGFGGNSSNKYITTYFRRNFDLTQAVALACSVKIDDGVVVYLNGSEVFRNNMPAGNISFSTLALNGNNENAWFSFEIPVSMAINGTNQLAVEIHQNSPSSSDMSFDFRMVALPSPPPPSAEGVYINEIMASNSNTIDDATGSSSDWIEIFNNTNQVLNLNNYYLTDDKNNLTKFRFSSSINIPTNSYKIIWASGEISRGSDHTSWSLSADGEFVALVLPDGQTILDSLSFPKQKRDVSYGRLVGNLDSLVYFTPASPNAVNNNSNAYLGFLDPPTFSHESGFYTNSFNLSLGCKNNSSTIRYTLDGGEPSLANQSIFPYKNFYPQTEGEPLYATSNITLNNFVFTSSIPISIPKVSSNFLSTFNFTNFRYPYQPNYNIEKANIIKATCFQSNFISSVFNTKTYLYSQNGQNTYNFPLISLSLSPKDLLEYSSGISIAGITYDYSFLNYGRIPEAGNFAMRGKEWERDGFVEFFENQNINSNMKIRVRLHGNSARYAEKKSFRLYFPNPISLLNQDYPFFFEKYIIKDQGATPKNEISYEIVKNLDKNIQHLSQKTVFLNGEYWGNYNLMNHLDNDFIGIKNGLNSSNLDIIKDEKYDFGNYQNYLSLIDFVNQNNFNNKNSFDSLKALMDVDNFSNYIAMEVFLNNTDWPLNNTYFWRNRSITYKDKPISSDDGRWRWVIYDMDYTLENPQTNSIQNATGGSGTSLIFNKLRNSPFFRPTFVNRFADLLNTNFSNQVIIEKYNTVFNDYQIAFQKDRQRWQSLSSDSEWFNKMNNIYTFLNTRTSIQRTHIQTEFSISGTYNLTVNSSNLNQGYVRVNSIDILPTTPGIPANPSSWTGIYFDNIPINIIAKPKKGYKFSHWIHNGQTLTDSVLTINTSSDKTYTAFFEVQIISNNPFPLAYNLNNCTYPFLGWPSSSPVGSYPANMQLVYFNAADPTLSAEIEGFTNGGFDGTSRTRMNGLNQNGLSFINTGGSAQPGYTTAKLGGAILALNTQGVDTVKIKWTGRTIVPNSRKYGIRLQYREGDIQPFKDFNPPIEYLGNPNANDSLVLQNLVLPHDLINKPYVQLLWRYYFTGEGSGARDQLAIDDVVIKVSKRHAGTIGNVTQGNPAYYYLTNQMGNSVIANYQAHHSITMSPGFEVNSGSVFTAKIEGCEN
jgi:hypothetical protein